MEGGAGLVRLLDYTRNGQEGLTETIRNVTENTGFAVPIAIIMQ
jgi:hypothetical protein